MQQGERLTYFAFDLPRTRRRGHRPPAPGRAQSSWPLVGDQLGRDTGGPASTATRIRAFVELVGKPPPFWGRCRWRTNTSIPPRPARAIPPQQNSRKVIARFRADEVRRAFAGQAGSQRYVVRTVGRIRRNRIPCGRRVETPSTSAGEGGVVGGAVGRAVYRSPA